LDLMSLLAPRVKRIRIKVIGPSFLVDRSI